MSLDQTKNKLIQAEVDRIGKKLLEKGYLNDEVDVDYLDSTQILEILHFSRSTLYTQICENRFPAPVGKRKVSLWTTWSVAVFILCERKVLPFEDLLPYLKEEVVA